MYRSKVTDYVYFSVSQYRINNIIYILALFYISFLETLSLFENYNFICLFPIICKCLKLFNMPIHNIESLVMDHSGYHIWGMSQHLHAKDPSVDLKKEQVIKKDIILFLTQLAIVNSWYLFVNIPHFLHIFNIVELIVILNIHEATISQSIYFLSIISLFN